MPYGTPTRLRDLAGITAPEPRLLVVQPWDASAVKAAEKYGLGYNLVAGANIAGFEKVAEAMMEQGIY